MTIASNSRWRAPELACPAERDAVGASLALERNDARLIG
jgi:hypothetical protein